MYGKHFESMYTGSMIGAGAVFFAVMGYIIAKSAPPNFEVELNPKLLAFIIGEPEEEIIEAIEKMCSPDPKSRSKAEEGRKLLKRGEYLYFVVNGEEYARLKNNSERQARWREQKQKQRGPEQAPPAKRQAGGTFQKPGREELNLHAAKIGLPNEEVDRFVNYYESNGWRVGRSKMVSWQHAMMNWQKNWRAKNPGSAGGKDNDPNAWIKEVCQ